MVGEVYLEWEERKSDGSPNISILILSLCFSSSYPQLSELFVFFSILSSKWLAGRRSINPNMVVYIGAALQKVALYCYMAHMDHWINFSTESARQIADAHMTWLQENEENCHAPLRRNAYILCTARWSLVSALQSSVFDWTCILGTVLLAGGP